MRAASALWGTRAHARSAHRVLSTCGPDAHKDEALGVHPTLLQIPCKRLGVSPSCLCFSSFPSVVWFNNPNVENCIFYVVFFRTSRLLKVRKFLNFCFPTQDSSAR